MGELNLNDGEITLENGVVTITTTFSNTSAIGGGFPNGSIYVSPNQTWPSTVATPLVGTGTYVGNPCVGGHNTDENQIEYIDGEIVAYCTGCGARISIVRVHGGMSMMRMKYFLGAAMAAEECDSEDISALIGELSALNELIEEEQFAFEESRKLFKIASRILMKKLEDGKSDLNLPST